MKGVICYISSSGHTELASRFIAGNLENIHLDLLNISREPAPDLDLYDLVGFATYTDYMNAPIGIQRFIRGLSQQNGKPAFVFSTYAMFTGWTLKFLSDRAREKGFRVVASGSLSMPECYPVLRNLGLHKDNNPSSATLNRFQKFITQIDSIAFRIQNNEKIETIRVWPSLVDMLMPILPRKTAKVVMGEKLVDLTRCNACGICASVCPYTAISMKYFPVFDEKRCNGCFSCYSKCPTHAIFTKRMKDKAFYHGPSVELRRKLML